LDFAGGTVVHISAGIAALVAALMMRGRQDRTHAPSNIPFVLLGTGMLWFGWFGFNAGSALAANETAVSAFLTTNTASAAAMVSWLFFDMARGRKPGALAGCVGAVVGLVAITPAAGFVTVGQSIIIGSLAALISNMAVHWKSQSQLDDTLDVFPCHGIGGVTGMILTGVFADKVGLVHGGYKLFGLQILGMLITAAFAFISSLILYKICDWLIPMRVTVNEENLGLDLSQHGESAESRSGGSPGSL
jgi:Amt family ammonium transporter